MDIRGFQVWLSAARGLTRAQRRKSGQHGKRSSDELRERGGGHLRAAAGR